MEQMTIALRVYLGAVMKRPENCMILPDVAFNGIISDSGILHIDAKKTGADHTRQTEATRLLDARTLARDPWNTNDFTAADKKKYQKELGVADLRMHNGAYRRVDRLNTDINGDWSEGESPLGRLDHPDYVEVVQGLQVYKPPVAHK